MKRPDPIIFIFKDSGNLARDLARRICSLVGETREPGRKFNLALSGGSTPRKLFQELAKTCLDPGTWDDVRFFWVDERCVPPDHPESNYRMAHDIFLGNLPQTENTVFRMRGEDNPAEEAERYGQLILEMVPEEEGIPEFDLILLGMGGDGHTASIFPGQTELLWTDRLCDVAVHPESGQKRITLTGKVLNNAVNVFFLVAGEDKAGMVAAIIGGPDRKDLPASHIRPRGHLYWFLDQSAATLLNKKQNPG